MRTPRQVGLIVEGNSTQSLTLRLPGIAEEIGPIKATTKRVARRVSNLLRTGRAIDRYEDLESCDLVLMRLPDSQVTRVVAELMSSQLRMSGKSFILCESWLPSEVLNPLRKANASVATTVSISSHRRNWFAVEGGLAAGTRIKKLLHKADSHAVDLKPGTKHLYFAGTTLAETLPRALYAAAQRAMRGSGLNGKHLHTVLEDMAQCMILDMTRGSRAGWSGPMLDCPADIAMGHMVSLRESSPELATFLAEQMRLAAPYTPARVGKPSKCRV